MLGCWRLAARGEERTCFSSSLTRSWYLCWRSFHKALRAYTLNESLSPRISSLSTLAFCRRKCDSCSLVVGRIPTLTPPPLLGDNPAHMNGPWLFRRLMPLMALASTSALSSCVSRRMGLMKPLAMLVCCSACEHPPDSQHTAQSTHAGSDAFGQPHVSQR